MKLDLSMEQKELLWFLATFIFAVLASGLFFDFNFIDPFQVQLYDSYVTVSPINVAGFLWVILTYVVFIIRGFITKFSSHLGLWFLLISNSILLVFVIQITYITWHIIGIPFGDLFRTLNYNFLSGQFGRAILQVAGLTLFFVVIEFLFLKRLLKLRRLRKLELY